MSPKQNWILARRVLSLLLGFLVLTGLGPCSNGFDYFRSRTCTTLSMDVTVGQPGVLIPSCFQLPTDVMEITLDEKITFSSIPSFVMTNIVFTRNSKTIQVTPSQAAPPGNTSFFVHTQPTGRSSGRGALIQPYDYTIVVNIHAAPPPHTTATPGLVGTGGSTTLSTVVSGGHGPFIYDWRGYRDDGVPGGAITMSSCSAATPQATLLQPDWDFLFFVTVLDVGAGNCIEIKPGDTAPSGAFTWTSHCGDNGPPPQYYCTTPNQSTVVTGSVRVHESDGPVASFTVAPGPFHANIDDIFFDASSSTNVAVPVSWSIQYAGNIFPATPEDFMLLPFGSWSTVYTVDTNTLQMNAPFDVFSQPGAYRAQLTVIDDNFNSHTATQYFTVLP